MDEKILDRNRSFHLMTILPRGSPTPVLLAFGYRKSTPLRGGGNSLHQQEILSHQQAVREFNSILTPPRRRIRFHRWRAQSSKTATPNPNFRCPGCKPRLLPFWPAPDQLAKDWRFQQHLPWTSINFLERLTEQRKVFPIRSLVYYKRI